MNKENYQLSIQVNNVIDESSLSLDTVELSELAQVSMRFTGWLKIVVKRAKIDYIRSKKKYQAEISIEKIASDRLACDFQPIENERTFDFENDLVAEAFSKLPIKRRQVLIMLFVKKMTPEEIAEEIGCSVQHIYNQRSLGLKELKLILNKENS